MIPKIIHYCWLSGEPYPVLVEKCINSWKKNLPEYDFVLWDANRVDTISNLWLKQAYENKSMHLQQIIFDFMLFIITEEYI